MDTRVKKLEDEVTKLTTDVTAIKSNYATKVDVVEAKNAIIMWVAATVLLAQLLPAILKKFGM